jgi:membrane associated rhomboid family serine protease
VFPLQTLRKTKNTPYMTYTLIAVNVLIFLWEVTLSHQELSNAFWRYAVVPCEMSRNLFSADTLFDTVRAMFLHGGWLHIVGNMVFLHIFGPNMEDYLGKWRFLVFYLVAGFVASFVHTAIHYNTCIPSIGASGAIYGLMGGFFLLYPATKVRTIGFFFRVPIGTVDVQAFYMLLYYFAVDFINGLGQLGVGNSGTSGVAFWAHVGGFLAGVLMAFTIMTFKPPPPVDSSAHLDF